MEQILPAYGLPKETVSAITRLYRNTKVKVHSPDGDTDFFDIVAGVLERDTWRPYLFIIYQDNVLRMSIDLIKENGFTLRKARSRRYPDACYADDLVLLANTSTQAESLLYSFEYAAGGIRLHVNTKKMEYMCFKREGIISTLSCNPLKSVDKFTSFSSWVSSTERRRLLSIGYRSYGSLISLKKNPIWYK